MKEIQHENPPVNFERFALIYAPLLVAWWIGMTSVEQQLNSRLYGIILVTIVISIVFVLVRKIETTIYNGKPKSDAIKYVVLAIIPLWVTFACNLNAIYPAIMKDYLLREELEQKRNLLKMAGEEAAKNLTDTDLNIWRSEVDSLIGQLETQINSPFNKGVGALAEGVLKQLENKLGQQITRHRNIAKGREKEIFEKYKEDILKLRKNNRRQEKHVEQEGDLVWIKGAVEQVVSGKDGLEAVTKLLSEGQATPAMVLLAVKDAANVYNEAVIRTRRHVPNAFPNGPDKVTVVNGEFGKLSHTFESATLHLQNKGTWVALFFALLIDLWAIVLAFLYTGARLEHGAHNHVQQMQLGMSRLHRLQ